MDLLGISFSGVSGTNISSFFNFPASFPAKDFSVNNEQKFQSSKYNRQYKVNK